MRSYIQLVIDSFSKRILAFSVALSISGKATADLLRSALETLPRTREESIADYNARPHYALHGLTPDDTYAGKVFDLYGYKERLTHAQERRLSENRSTAHPCKPDINKEIKED